MELELRARGPALGACVPVTMAALEMPVTMGINQLKLQVMQGMGMSREELDVGAGAKVGIRVKLSV
jgi:hypothetical protein